MRGEMTSKRYVLDFPTHLLDKPLTYHLVKDFDLVVNILRAHITPEERGRMVVELSGSEDAVGRGLAYLVDHGVVAEPETKQITWDDKACVDCGACTALCPTDARYMDKETWKLVFDRDRCIVCGLCVTACPLRIITVAV